MYNQDALLLPFIDCARYAWAWKIIRYLSIPSEETQLLPATTLAISVIYHLAALRDGDLSFREEEEGRRIMAEPLSADYR